MHSGKLCGMWWLFFPMTAVRVTLDPGQQGAEGWMGMEGAAQPFGLARMQSWKALCMRKTGHEMKGKKCSMGLTRNSCDLAQSKQRDMIDREILHLSQQLTVSTT